MPPSFYSSFMDLKTFQKRFSLSREAHPEFIIQMKAVDPRLDCVFNRLEECWMVILWQNPNEWHWVMTLRDHETGARYLPCSFVIDRLQELKWKWENHKIEAEIEAAEAIREKDLSSRLEDSSREVAKSLRKILINDMDGVVSNWNVFI